MKRISFMSFIVLAMFFTSSPVFAQTTTPSLTITPTPKSSKWFKDFRQNRPKPTNTLTKTPEQQRIQSATKVSTEIQKELNKRLSVLINLKNKLIARTQKTPIKRNYAQSTAKLAEFDTQVTNFNRLLGAFQAQVNQMITMNHPNIIADIRAAAKPLRTQLQTMQKTLIDSLHLIIRAPKI